jgi:hypothetical protein
MDFEPQSPVIHDDGSFPTLMPTLVRARQVRLVAWFLCFWGTAIGIYVARVVGFDLYVRSHWTVVEGDIIKYEEKSASTGSIRSRALTYWTEFEVEFNSNESGCNTGMSWGVKMPFQCIGTVKSPASQSLSIARNWAYRHPAGSHAKFYYDPATGHLRFAGESVLDLYPWVAIIAFVVAGTVGVILLSASRHRLKQLKTSLEDYGTTAVVIENTDPDDLTDLKLQ